MDDSSEEEEKKEDEKPVDLLGDLLGMGTEPEQPPQTGLGSLDMLDFGGSQAPAQGF